MELRNLTQFPTDYLDAYCDAEVGHTNWAFIEDIGNDLNYLDKIHQIIVIYKEPEEEE